MEKESSFFSVMKQFPKLFQIVIYSFFTILLIVVSASYIYSTGIISNFRKDNHFVKNQNSFIDDNTKIKLENIKNEFFIKNQKELLGIDTLRIKYKLDPISNPKAQENGNLLDGGPISNILYYAISLAIIIVAFSFKNSTNYLYLILNICFVMLLIGLFALLKGIMTPTNIKYSYFEINTASVGAIICLFATIIAIITVRKIEKQKNQHY